jgi:hypothetical protein
MLIEAMRCIPGAALRQISLAVVIQAVLMPFVDAIGLWRIFQPQGILDLWLGRRE